MINTNKTLTIASYQTLRHSVSVLGAGFKYILPFNLRQKIASVHRVGGFKGDPKRSGGVRRKQCSDRGNVEMVSCKDIKLKARARLLKLEVLFHTALCGQQRDGQRRTNIFELVSRIQGWFQQQ